MALTPAFTVSQGIDASVFIITDTSTGSDGAITTRRIYVQLADGSYLVPTDTTTDYIDFPLSDGASKTLDILNIDYAVSITLQWLSSGDVVLYTLSQSYCFTENDEQFMYNLVQYMNANKTLLSSRNFIFSCFELDMYVTYAELSVTTGNDISGAQFLLTLAQNMVDNPNVFK